MNDYDGIFPQTANLCDHVIRETGANDPIALATEIYKHLAAQYRDGGLEQAMASLGIETKEKLLDVSDRYLKWKADHPESDPVEKDATDTTTEDNSIAASSISDITLFVIDNIVKRTRITDRYDVMEHVCDVLEHRFGTGEKLEQNLEKLNLSTTKDVLNAIDIYFVMRQLYPDTVFGRKRMQNVWAPSFQACLPIEEVS